MRPRAALPLLLGFGLASGARGGWTDPALLVGECWKDLSTLQQTCSNSQCSDECIGKSDALFRRWDKCTSDSHRTALISTFDRQIWQCFSSFQNQQNPYLCSHMALFAKACEEELTNAFGSVKLVRGSDACRRVQDGCTGGGGTTGVNQYYRQFPVLFEHDKCAAVLASEGGANFLDAYASNCSDAVGCATELSSVRQLCAGKTGVGNVSCDSSCKSAIDGLFSSADGGASWALCQGVRVPTASASAQRGFDYRFGSSATASATSKSGAQWSTFGREAVSLYNSYHFKGCGGGGLGAGHASGESCVADRHESSLLVTNILLMLACGGGSYLAMRRADRTGPLGRALDARLAAPMGGAQSPSDREATARRFNGLAAASLLLSLFVIMSAWACIWLPVGMMGGVTGLIAALISRSNLKNLLTPVSSDGHAPSDCCGDVGGGDRTKWLEPVASLHITTAVLCGIGALINLLFGKIFVDAGHQADNGFCYRCPATQQVYCDWSSCFDKCGCSSSSAYSCCASEPCSTSAGECGVICQYGALALLSVGVLLVLMGNSIASLSATHALRRSWRGAHAPAEGAAVLSLSPAVNAVVVQAEPASTFGPGSALGQTHFGGPAMPMATATAYPATTTSASGFPTAMPMATAVGVRQA